MFLPSGTAHTDPFDREENYDSDSNYERIIRSVEFGCISQIPTSLI